MALSFAIRTTIEIIGILLLLYGFCREDRFIAFEDRLKTKILDRKEAKRHAEKIKVIVKDPGKPARVVWISNTLENLQRTVGGYIETVTISTDVVIICNEEGKLLGLPHNCRLCGCDFVGTLIIVGIDKDEFCSLSDEIIRLLKPVIKEKKS